MLEKRSKVIEELLQTERDYIRDLEMCVERIMVPLQQAQVRVWGKAMRWWWWGGVRYNLLKFLKPRGTFSYSRSSRVFFTVPCSHRNNPSILGFC